MRMRMRMRMGMGMISTYGCKKNGDENAYVYISGKLVGMST
jgi:hypothetical protein